MTQRAVIIKFPDGRERISAEAKFTRAPKRPGWTSHLAVLQEKLAGRGVGDFWALHARSREAVAMALG